jgi:peptide/nickel transport system substrate-binding protein
MVSPRREVPSTASCSGVCSRWIRYPSRAWHSREITKGVNYAGFIHPRVDELSDLSITELDQERRAAMLREVWRIVAEEQPFTFLFYPENLVALKSDVRGFVHHPQLDLYRLNDWWLDR